MIPIIPKQGSYPTNAGLKGKDGNASLAGVRTLMLSVQKQTDKVSTALTTYHGVDVLANRPPAGMLGRHFYATDQNTMYEDIGSGWVPIGGSAPFTPVAASSNLTVTNANNLYLITTGTSTVTLTLPPATGSNFAPIFKHLDTMGNLVIQPAGSDTIDTNGGSFLVKSIWRKLQLIDYESGGWAII